MHRTEDCAVLQLLDGRRVQILHLALWDVDDYPFVSFWVPGVSDAFCLRRLYNERVSPQILGVYEYVLASVPEVGVNVNVSVVLCV